MRSLGQFAREEELQQMLHEVDINGTYSRYEFIPRLSDLIRTFGCQFILIKYNVYFSKHTNNQLQLRHGI